MYVFLHIYWQTHYYGCTAVWKVYLKKFRFVFIRIIFYNGLFSIYKEKNMITLILKFFLCFSFQSVWQK